MGVMQFQYQFFEYAGDLFSEFKLILSSSKSEQKQYNVKTLILKMAVQIKIKT